MRRHILILVENLSVPFDRRVWQESRALVEAGFEVTSSARPEPIATREREVVDRGRADPALSASRRRPVARRATSANTRSRSGTRSG